MKTHLTVHEMLIWHDQPQLFVAKDKIGGQHLCLAIDDEGNFISVALSAERLQSIRQCKTDLYTAFAQSELGRWSLVAYTTAQQLEAELQPDGTHIPEAYLPELGAFLPRQALFSQDAFSVVKVSAVAKEAGMNPTLLRQYLAGVKYPSREQAKRIQDALHRVAQRLLAIELV
jgi:hypothetical protein